MLEHTRTTTILLAEDDPDVAGMLVDLLQAKGYVVSHAANGAQAEALAADVAPDLVIVDLLLPDANGLVLCADLKQRTGAPVVVCSGSKRRDDPVLSFKLGADDFISKPFAPAELLAGVEAVRRRAGEPERAGRPQSAPQSTAGSAAAAEVIIGKLAIDAARCRVTLHGKELHLTPNEYRLLLALASRPDQVVSRKELTESVWGSDDLYAARNLDVHMSRLRAKLAAAGSSNEPALLTVRGFGYRLASRAERASAPAA